MVTRREQATEERFLISLAPCAIRQNSNVVSVSNRESRKC